LEKDLEDLGAIYFNIFNPNFLMAEFRILHSLSARYEAGTFSAKARLAK
jgi:hypothetical protein